MFSSSGSTRNQCRYWFQSSIWRVTKMHKRDHRPLHPRCSGYGWITYWQTSVLSQPDSATLHCISDFLPDKWNNSFFADHRICYPNNNIHKWDRFSNRFTAATWVIQKYAKSWIIPQRLNVFCLQPATVTLPAVSTTSLTRPSSMAISATQPSRITAAEQTAVVSVSPTWSVAEIDREKKRSVKKKILKELNIFTSIMQMLTLGWNINVLL